MKEITVKQVNEATYNSIQNNKTEFSIGGSTRINNKWVLDNVTNRIQTPTHSMLLGQIIHLALLEPEKFEKFTTLAENKTITEKEFKNYNIPYYYHYIIKNCLQPYFFKQYSHKIIEAELPLICNDFEIILRAKLDFVYRDTGGQLVVTDIKTTSYRKTDLPRLAVEYNHQAKLYSYLAENYYNEEIKFQFLFMGGIEEATPFTQLYSYNCDPYNEAEIELLIHNAKNIIKKIKNNLIEIEELPQGEYDPYAIIVSNTYLDRKYE